MELIITKLIFLNSPYFPLSAVTVSSRNERDEQADFRNYNNLTITTIFDTITILITASL